MAKQTVTIPMDVYRRGAFRVLPLIVGYAVVDNTGKVISQEVEIDAAVDFADELAGKAA